MHVAVLAEALQIPATVGCSQGSVCDGVEALCNSVKRHVLSMSVQRHGTMVRQAWPVPVISMITNEVLDYIYATHGHRIQQ